MSRWVGEVVKGTDLALFPVVNTVVKEIDILSFFRRATSVEKSFSPAVIPSKNTTSALAFLRSVSNTLLTLPTRRIVWISLVAVSSEKMANGHGEC